MEKLTNKQLVNRLNEILDGLNIDKQTVLVQSVNPKTNVVRNQAKNMRKTMLKMFKSLDYDRQILELMGLEARLEFEQSRLRPSQQAEVASLEQRIEALEQVVEDDQINNDT